MIRLSKEELNGVSLYWISMAAVSDRFDVEIEGGTIHRLPDGTVALDVNMRSCEPAEYVTLDMTELFGKDAKEVADELSKALVMNLRTGEL